MYKPIQQITGRWTTYLKIFEDASDLIVICADVENHVCHWDVSKIDMEITIIRYAYQIPLNTFPCVFACYLHNHKSDIL